MLSTSWPYGNALNHTRYTDAAAQAVCYDTKAELTSALAGDYAAASHNHNAAHAAIDHNHSRASCSALRPTWGVRQCDTTNPGFCCGK